MSWGDSWKLKLNTEGKNIPFDLPIIAFNAFKHNDFSFIQDKIMTVDRYLVLGRSIEPSEVSDEEIALLAEQAANRTQEVSSKSFTLIQNFLEEKKFDWARAKLKDIKVKTVSSSTSPSQWQDYLHQEEKRLDIYLFISDENRNIVIKLDDCFKIGEEKERFLGGGFNLK